MSDIARVYEAIKSAGGEWVNAQEICDELKLDRRIVTDYASSMMGRRKELYPGIKRSKTKKVKSRAFSVQVHIHDIKYRWVSDGK